MSSAAVPRIVALGSSAALALTRSGGALRLVPGFTDTPYRLAGEDIVWVGMHGEAHPRAVFLDAPLERLAVSWDQGHPVPAALHRQEQLTRALVAPHFSELARRCHELGTPGGLGRLLLGQLLPFPLDARVEAAHGVAAAIAAQDTAAFERNALRLLGVGGGLTPSGDDFVGAALFTLHHLGESQWQGVADALVAAVPERSHVISAALFADLARGESFEPLHQILAGTAEGIAGMMAPARRLAAIGHSSGWDMLTGMIAAATGTLQHTVN